MNRLVFMLLTAALVFNLIVSPVYAYDAVNTTAEKAGNVWVGSAKDNQNSLPAYAKGADGINRRPDVGEKTESGQTIISVSDSGIIATVRDQKIAMSGWGGSLELAPESGCFDRAETTDCAVRYTNVSRNIDYQFSAIDGEAEIKALYEGVGECNSFVYDLRYSEDMAFKPSAGGYVIYQGTEPVLSISAPVAVDIGGAVGEAFLALDEKGKLTLSVNEAWLNDLDRAYPVSVSFTIGAYQMQVLERTRFGIPRMAAEDCPYDFKVDVSYDDVDGSSTKGLMSFNSLTVIEAEGETGTTPPAEGDGEQELSLKITDAKSGAELEMIEDFELDVPVEYTFEPGIFYQLYLVKDEEEIELDHFLVYQATGRLTRGVAFVGYKYDMDDPEDLIEDNDLDDTKMIIEPGSTIFVRNPDISKDPKMQIGNPIEEELAAMVAWLLGKGVKGLCEFGLEPINYNTGNFLYDAQDLKLPDYTGEFTLDRIYNSIGSKKNGAFGYGWEFAYDISLSLHSGGVYVLQLGDGRTVWLRWNGSQYVGDSGTYFALSRTGGGYSVTNTQDKIVYQFNWNGELTAISDVGGNTCSFTQQDHKLAQIITPVGYQIGVACDEKDRITSFILPDGKTIRYAYDGDGNLSSVTDQENRTTVYAYDSGHRLISVTDPEGTITVKNTYDENNRVVSQLDGNGNTASLAYESGKTTVTDNNGNQTQVFFDESGRTIKVIRPDGSTERKTWDDANNMTSYTDAYGVTTRYEYNASGLITKETRSDGAYTAYTYNENNKALTYTDHNGNTTKYEYDSRGNLTKTIYADGSSVQYTYNDHNQVVSVKNQLGSTVTFEYAGALCTAFVDGLGARTEYGYSVMGWLTSMKDAAGNATRYLYNACGERYAEQRPDGSLYTYVYNDAGYVTAIQDEMGYVSEFSYDKQGNMLQGTDPQGNSLIMSYDRNYNKLTSEDSLGRKTSYTYNSMDRIKKVIDPMGGVTEYTYDAVENVTGEKDPNGNLTVITYDKVLGLTATVTESEGKTTAYAYDKAGNVIQITYADGSCETFEYDSLYRVSRAVSVLGLVTEYTYDKAGNVIKTANSEGQVYQYTYDANSNLTSLTDQENRTVNYTYDLLSCLTGVTEAGNIKTQYTYDSVGNLVSQTDGQGNTTKYTYNLNNQLTSIETPMGYTENLKYNLNGKLETYTNPDGRQINYDYDVLDQMISKLAPSDGKTSIAAYGYDADGNRVSMEDVTGTTDYEYDLAGRLASVTTKQGGKIEYAYDVYGNIVSMTYPDGGKVSYTYDALDRMTAITGRDGKTTTYAYDVNGNMTKVTRPNGTFTELKYDAEGRITTLSNVKNNGNIISDFYYTYDIFGCIIKETARQDGETVTTSYAYDGRMQLVSAAEVHPGYTLKTEYTYDNAGNRITEKVSKTQWGSTSVITDLINTYDADNRLIKQTNNASSWSRSITYQYDENGNMIRKDPPNSSYTIYEYDSENRLTAVHDGGALLFAALYDGNGDRVFTVAPRQNTGNWHDDWNDGRWAVAEPQNGYNDSEWTYSGADTKPTEPTTEEPETEPIIEPSTEPVSETPTTTRPDRPVNPGEDDGSWWPGKYEGGDTGVDDGQWNLEETTASGITTTTSAVSSEEWSSSKAYNAGDEVSYQGKRYRAKWWTKGENPAANASEDWQVWVLVSGTKTTTAAPETTTNQTSTVTTTVPATKPEEGETEPGTFEVTGNADYDRDMIWDVLYVPNGINTAYLEENYVLTGYINDVNTEYTQVLAEYGKSGDYDSVYEYGVRELPCIKTVRCTPMSMTDGVLYRSW